MNRGAIRSDTDRILFLTYLYPHSTFEKDTDPDIDGCEKNDIYIRQNWISDMNQILADQM